MKVKFSFDDGSKEDLRVAELLAKYDIYDAIFYVPAEWHSYNLSEGREPLTYSDAQGLRGAFKIGSHGITHSLLTRIQPETAEAEIKESYYLTNALFGDVDSFCYPRGYANDFIRQTTRKYYKSARNTLVGNLKESEDPIWETPTVHICGKRRKEYERTTWLEEAYRLLDEAVQAEDSVYHAWGHSWEITRYDGWHDFEELLKKIQAVS